MTISEHPWLRDLYCSEHGLLMKRTAMWSFDIHTGEPVVSGFMFVCGLGSCPHSLLFGVTQAGQKAAARLAGPAPTAREIQLRAARDRRQVLAIVGLYAAIAIGCWVVLFQVTP